MGLFSKSSVAPKSSHRAPHMTWASATLSRTVSRTGAILRREVWVWPIVAVVVLSVVGLLVRGAIETTMKNNLRSELETLLSVEVAMVETYLAAQKNNAQALANDREVRTAAHALLSAGGPPDGNAPERGAGWALANALGPGMSSHDYNGFFLTNKQRVVVAASEPELVGMADPPKYSEFVGKCLEGQETVSRPLPSIVTLKDESLGLRRTGVPTMFVCAPVRDDDFQVVGCLALRLAPDKEFTRILQLGRLGESGETYAFDRDGLMLSNSRFDETLVLLGLLPDEPGVRSILRLLVRDPGGDITAGFRPKVRRAELPPTAMVQRAVASGAGVDVEGYRDYRGVPVIGAWTWLPMYNLGVAAEIDVAEAYRPLTILRWTFWGLFTLLAASSLAIFVFTLMLARAQRKAQQAAIEAQQLGQYKLEQKLGAGAMGVVYKGRHAMLRRPTAIKMLSVDNVTESSIQRFEREVQITSQLNHPNTVAIYDYGRTPEGVFYYAMEFLDGIDLQDLVDRYGPQPPARVIHVLRQVCGSLYEAHSMGLVHRDIKPANIMLNRRGGEPDLVKVLDFGLVKALDDGKQARASQQNGLTGTPLYMSPEAIQMPNSVDARSDLYAVGAVGYFLLTGRPVFEASNLVELCQKQIDSVPEPPSKRTGTPTPEDLEGVLLACLEKSIAKRPQTARELSVQLGRCRDADGWRLDEADSWWSRHERGLVPAGPSGLSGSAPATKRDLLMTTDS